MGQLIETAQTAYDDFWTNLKSSDLTKVDMNAAMVQKTTLELEIDKAKEKEALFEKEASAVLIAHDAQAQEQLEAKRLELATLESTLSTQRTEIETLWELKRTVGKYDMAYVPSE